MGGGPREPQQAGEEYQPLIEGISRVCEPVSHGNLGSIAELEDDYKRVDDVLKELQHGPGLLSKCAAHVEMMGQMRQLAQRYQDVEVSSSQVVGSSLDVADGLIDALPPLQGALETNAPGARAAVQLSVNRLSQLSTLVEAAAATHKAVAMELEKLMMRAGEIARRPSKADLGLEAAPLLGGAAGTAALVLIRVAGPVGVLGALGLVAGGALTGSTAATALYPQIRRLFTRLVEEWGQVAAQVKSKAMAMETLAAELGLTAGHLISTLDIVTDGSEGSRQLFLEALAACSASLEVVTLRCASCRYRTSAFLLISPPERKLLE